LLFHAWKLLLETFEMAEEVGGKKAARDVQKTVRTFIGFKLPESVITQIRKVQDEIKTHDFRLKWVRPESIHLTLKFLGNIGESDVRSIETILEKTAAGFSALSLSAKGVGVFPGLRRPRVLWVGLSGEVDTLMRLQQTLEENLSTVGFPKEKRPFRGHLTLARVKAHLDSRKIGAVLSVFGEFESDVFIADQMILFKSELKPEGAVYTELLQARLAV
jgi:2'-5' RNA ligase